MDSANQPETRNQDITSEELIKYFLVRIALELIVYYTFSCFFYVTSVLGTITLSEKLKINASPYIIINSIIFLAGFIVISAIFLNKRGKIISLVLYRYDISRFLGWKILFKIVLYTSICSIPILIIFVPLYFIWESSPFLGMVLLIIVHVIACAISYKKVIESEITQAHMS
jgi:hypothetical protein